MGDSFLDTGGLPFGWTHSWVQGDSPLGDSFLNTGELPIGGLIPVYRGTPLWGTLFLDTGGLPPLGNSFLWGGVIYACPREDSFLSNLATFFLPLGSSFSTSGGLIPAHRTVKKRLATFPSPAGMLLTILYLGGNNLIIPPRESLVSDMNPGWGRECRLPFFYSASSLLANCGKGIYSCHTSFLPAH